MNYAEQIREILSNTYDVCALSPDVGSTLVSRNSNKLYCYTLDKKFEREVFALLEMLNAGLCTDASGSIKELLQGLRKDIKKSKQKLSQCAIYTQKGHSWNVEFYCIEGVRFHKTYGGRIAAALVLQNMPVIELSGKKKDTLYGLWDETFPSRSQGSKVNEVTRGMNYRANRNIYDNLNFRSFVISFFMMIANSEKKHILKDIADTIARCGCFLPSLSAQKILTCHSRTELIKLAIPKAAQLNINFENLDLNVGYVIARIAPYCSEADISKLLQMRPEILGRSVSLVNLFDGMGSVESVTEFLSQYQRNSSD